MKTSAICLLILILATSGCGTRGRTGDAVPAVAGGDPVPLRVVVVGIDAPDGDVLVAVFGGPDGFPGESERAVLRQSAPAGADSVVFEVDLPAPGRYAVSVLHDANENGEMETDFFGRPTEGYGFSRDARGSFGPPGFDDAAIDAGPSPTTIRIRMEY